MPIAPLSHHGRKPGLEMVSVLPKLRRIIHSITDEEVPFELALKLVNNCMGNDASLTLLKGSLHSMEAERDMNTMRSKIIEVIEAYTEGGYDLRSPGSG